MGMCRLPNQLLCPLNLQCLRNAIDNRAFALAHTFAAKSQEAAFLRCVRGAVGNIHEELAERFQVLWRSLLLQNGIGCRCLLGCRCLELIAQRFGVAACLDRTAERLLRGLKLLAVAYSAQQLIVALCRFDDRAQGCERFFDTANRTAEPGC